MIHIVDYGAGNIGSIVNMIKKVGGQSTVTSKPEDILSSSKLILPGVGHFDNGMKKLRETGLIEVLNEKVLRQKCPVLGICLGAQMMTRASEEGVEEGLGWFDAHVLKFKNMEGLKVPHMGWNRISVEKQTPLCQEMTEDFRYYFVHSYFMQANNSSDVLFRANYGTSFAAGLNHENIFAVQFHPEKSHKFGMILFRNFISL